MNAQIQFTLNGKRTSVAIDDGRTLLEVLREDLGLTGAKYGCGEGQCGACSVLLDGKRIFSCRTAVGKVAGRDVLTIEGLAPAQAAPARDDGGADAAAAAPGAARTPLHPVQEAFLAEGAYQCGYCVPGMILTAVALLKENPKPTDEQIVAGMNRNLCRCCNYGNLIAAVRRAARRATPEGR